MTKPNLLSFWLKRGVQCCVSSKSAKGSPEQFTWAGLV